METTKEKNPKKDVKIWQKARERENQVLQKNQLNSSASSTTIAAIEEPIVETRKAGLIEKLDRAYQYFFEIEEYEVGDPEPSVRKVLPGLVFLTEMQDKPTQELLGG